MSANTIDSIRSTLITTDDIQTTSVDYADLPSDCSFSTYMTIIARNINNGDTAVFWKAAAGKKIGSTVDIVGSIVDAITPQNDTSLTTLDCTISANSSNLQVLVTGISATSIEWMVSGNIIIS